MGEVFEDREHVNALVTASCRLPLISGLLPLQFRGKWYYDGMFWKGDYVPRKKFTRQDFVVAVSGFGLPGAQIMPPGEIIPMWWGIIAPSREVLRGMVAAGFDDTAEYFKHVTEEMGVDVDAIREEVMKGFDKEAFMRES